MSTENVVPTVGMQVTWIKPENAHPKAASFIELAMIPEHGEGPFFVRSVERSHFGILVRLNYQDGKPVRMKWSNARALPPKGWRGVICQFNWDQYLCPV